MTVTLADVDQWDPNRIREAFQAVIHRSDAAADVHMSLAGLPVFLSWDGEAAQAAHTAVSQTRSELLLHSREATMVATRAQDAIEMITDVKKKLQEADKDARQWQFKIDRTTGDVMPIDPATIGQPDTTVHFVQLGSLVEKILVEANAADMELARAINIADGVEPVVTDLDAARQQAIDESIDQVLHGTPLPPGVDPRVVRGMLQDTAQGFPAPRAGELGIPGYPDATLTADQARNVYTYGEQQMKNLNQRLIEQGMSPEMRAKTLFSTRNALRSWTRDLMVDRAEATRLDLKEPNKSWDEIAEKYSSQGVKDNDLWNRIIDSSMRSRASVNADLGVDPDFPELPQVSVASGPSGPGVPLPEVPAPDVPAPPVLELPPVIEAPVPEIPELPFMPIVEP